MKSQLEYRLWIYLQASDMMASASRRQPLLIIRPRDGEAYFGFILHREFLAVDRHFAFVDALKHILNCNDVDLDTEGYPLIHDSSIITDVSFDIVRFRLATHEHQHYEACLEAKGGLSEFELTRLDRNLRGIMDGIAGVCSCSQETARNWLTEWTVEPVMPPGGPPFSSSISLLLRESSVAPRLPRPDRN